MLKATSINTRKFFKSAYTRLKTDAVRKNILQDIAHCITQHIQKEEKINLNFICTHNSRRSQLAQVWASYASHYFGLNGIESFSGGTSVTAFYRNTVKTLQKAGFTFQILEFSHQNPEYLITYEGCLNPIVGYSKLFDDQHNKKPFIAITTCSNADENCPYIADAVKRFHLPYNDPKNFDSTLYQAEKYLEVNKNIAGEIYYIFKTIAKSV